MYNTAFWALVQQGGKSTAEAHQELAGTLSGEKNELVGVCYNYVCLCSVSFGLQLFSQFDINYNNVDAMFRKGSLLVKRATTVTVHNSRTGVDEERTRTQWMVVHEDIIGDAFWQLDSTKQNVLTEK